MKQTEVSRRMVVGVLGVGAAAAATTAASNVLAKSGAGRSTQGASPGKSQTAGTSKLDPALAASTALVAPLQPGDQLDRWTVEQIHPVDNGAASVVLRDAQGQSFQLDICKRDPDAVSGPGRTEAFEIYLANHGDGSKSTVEEHGLAAMALAEVVRGNEQRVDHSLFKTLSVRVHQDVARVHVG